MKLHFEPDLDYQQDAIAAVRDLFRGQEICRSEFTVTAAALDGAMLPGFESSLGIGNRRMLVDEELLENLRKVQLRSGLAPSDALDSLDFTVEMETGTGKTYVYLRTIFELHRDYGFTKFVIVVPSVAIKEGVRKTLEITEAHFKALYSGVPFEHFVYDSSKLGQVRSFATSAHLQVMVVTVGAINKKDVNNLYKDSEKTGGEKPIDLIRATRPVVIVDEPQSVDGGLEGRGKEALAAMHPLCTLRYSATHADKHHMVYRLNAVDAYERRLVKQIEVASATVEDAHNRPYVRLVSVSSKRGVVSARVELDVKSAHGVSRIEVTVHDGDDLEQTTEREVYRNCLVGDLRAGRGDQQLELRVPGGQLFLRPGEAFGDIEALGVQRQMIRRTIKEHLDKELLLRPKGIKVLSLFFIDEVAKYRRYDADGNVAKGEYATIFEEEYRSWANHPDYRTLFAEADLAHPAEAVHDGYFSIDKKGRAVDTSESNQTGRDAAESAYNLIMRNKEDLLSFGTPLKFIFSHSALREGWDNPNVFQICTLREVRSERERRQTIGRGLRLCVDQQGQRQRGFEVNTLTVVATESYESFAENLQREIEQETGIRFGVIEAHQFTGVVVTAGDGSATQLGIDSSKAVWKHLQALGYIDAQGKVQEALRTALRDGKVELPAEFAPQAPQIEGLLRRFAGRIAIQNADDKRPVLPRRAVLESAEFKALWDRIKHKTTYRVQFDNERLIKQCAEALRDAPEVKQTRLQWRKADLAIGVAGVEATERASYSVTLKDANIEWPDLLTELQDRTQLTRRSILRVLVESGRLEQFKRNPQAFIALAAEAINRCKRRGIVEGIKYVPLGGEHYRQELFQEQELKGYLKNLLEAQKSVYDKVLFDSAIEETFARDLEKNQAVKVYAKLPPWFTVPTPLGSYNPDWAVVVDRDGEERLYLVVETKGSLFTDDLRGIEDAKIKCGRAHFGALAVREGTTRYTVARTVEDILSAS